ncbi:MAG: hypothetical protein RL154_290, partial [Pseudomonadota bacterium]
FEPKIVDIFFENIGDIVLIKSKFQE